MSRLLRTRGEEDADGGQVAVPGGEVKRRFPCSRRRGGCTAFFGAAYFASLRGSLLRRGRRVVFYRYSVVVEVALPVLTAAERTNNKCSLFKNNVRCRPSLS